MPRHEVVSPIPGVFYRRPDPDSPPFTEEGASIGADQPVCVVEVMKSFHEVKAGVSGKIAKFLADNEEPVMAGQVLAEVEG